MATPRVVRRPATGRPTGVESASEEARAFLQNRLALLAKIWLIWSSALWVLASGLPLLSIGAVRSLEAQLIDLAIPVTMLGCWLICRRGSVPGGVLKGLDAGVLFVGCVGSTLHGLLSGPHQYYTNLVPLIAFMALLSRAVFVPSAPLRTWWLSLAVAAASLAVAVALRPPQAPAPIFSTTEATVWSVFSSLCAVVVATVASWVIYGLRKEAREARQLGQYTLEEKIGEGGMGAVYRARHAMLRRPTAVKLIRSPEASASVLARFEREVQLTSGLTHPNTIAIYDYGHTPDGVFYYAMEYVPGLSLDALVKTDGFQPERRVVHILRQICGALSEAHAIGLIHRDIKPANVMLCERGGVYDVVKVLDFGLVKELDGDEQGVTGVGTLTGTPLYLSPEAIQSAELVDARSDLYAVGAVAYFLITGHEVFQGRSTVEVLAHHLHTPPVRPSERLGHPVNPDLEELVLRCLSKDKEQRPTDARALLEVLETGPISKIGPWTAEEGRTWWETTAGACLECQAAVKLGRDLVEHSALSVDMAARLPGGDGATPAGAEAGTRTRPTQSWLDLWR